jgi:hypothetical protein
MEMGDFTVLKYYADFRKNAKHPGGLVEIDGDPDTVYKEFLLLSVKVLGDLYHKADPGKGDTMLLNYFDDVVRLLEKR